MLNLQSINQYCIVDEITLELSLNRKIRGSSFRTLIYNYQIYCTMNADGDSRSNDETQFACIVLFFIC